jgi:hypothetical protein
MMMVVKMRRSAHSIDMWGYTITKNGVEIGDPLRGYRALTSGIPEPWSLESGENKPEVQAPITKARQKRPKKGRPKK